MLSAEPEHFPALRVKIDEDRKTRTFFNQWL
jgi:hypothetical protein